MKEPREPPRFFLFMEIGNYGDQLKKKMGKAKKVRKRLQKREALYTTIFHSSRKKLDLTINEFCLADSIDKLSGSKSQIPGWCTARKEDLGEVLGFTRQSVHVLIGKLVKKGVVEVQEGSRYLKTTNLWYETVVVKKER